MKSFVLIYAVVTALLVGCGGGAPSTSTTGPTDAVVTVEPTTEVAVVDEAPSQAPAPLADGQTELHGTFAGKPFWARVTPIHPQIGHPLLRLHYTPPAKADISGVVMVEYPVLAVTDTGAIMGWQDESQNCLSYLRYLAKDKRYHINLEWEEQIGDEWFTREDQRTIDTVPSWDARIAPILLAVYWQAGTAAERPTIDFFTKANQQSTLQWDDTAVTHGAATWTITADAKGHLKTLTAANGTEVLTVAERTYLTRSETKARADRIKATGKP